MLLNTVFSHIVTKRLSKEYENVATEALAFVLDSSESARNGLMKLLRGIEPDLPTLRFRTQETDGNARPDMWGFDGTIPRAFVENKFWAGLTENQPVQYLRILAQHPQPSVLLMVVPTARRETVWRELRRRLVTEGISVTNADASVGGAFYSLATEPGPILALTSWERLLSAIDAELSEEPRVRNDLLQLHALCHAADSQAFVPISPEQLTDQQTPAFFLGLNSIVQGCSGTGRNGRHFEHEGPPADSHLGTRWPIPVDPWPKEIWRMVWDRTHALAESRINALMVAL